MHKLWKKELANHKIVTMAEVEKEATSLLPPKKKPLNCPKHPDEKLKLFCETCQELACLYCVFRDHQSHQLDTVSDVFPKHKAAIEGELEPLKEQHGKLTQAWETFDEREKEITAQRMELEAEINQRIDALCQLLQQRKAHLVSQLNQTAEQKLKRLAAQREELELRSAQVQNCIEYVEGSLRTSSPEEVLALNASTFEQLHSLTAELKEEKMEPQETAALELVMENLEQKCKELGMVTDEIPCPEKCPITGDGARFAVVGEKANVIVKLEDNKHIPCIKMPHTTVTAQLVDSTNQSITKCNVSNVQNGTYSIDYVPKRRGLHQLHVDIAGKPAKESPFAVTVMPAVTCFNQSIATFSTSQGPWGLGINSKQQLVVATTSANHVSILTLEGQNIRTFGGAGSCNGQFISPIGIAFDNEDNIYIADSKNNCIQKFTLDGNFIAAVGRQGSNQLEFKNPYGITFNKQDGKLYVSDTSNNRLVVLTTELQYCRSIGSQGAGNGQFNGPEDVAFDREGQIYVAERGNNRVQVLNAEGQHQYTIGENLLQYPRGVTVDITGRVFVIEHYISRISIFTGKGELIGSFNVGQHPLNITVDPKSTHFFVSSYSENKVLKF